MSNNVQGTLVSCRHASYARRGKDVRRDRGYAGHWVRVLALKVSEAEIASGTSEKESCSGG